MQLGQAFEMWHKSGEYFAPNLMLSSFGTNFASNWWVKTKLIEKRSLLQNRRLFDYVHSICHAVSQKSIWEGLFMGRSLLVL